MRSHWIEYRGQSIFYSDFTNYRPANLDQLQAEIQAVEEVICRQPANSILALTDIHGSVASPEIVDEFKRSAVRTRPHIRRQAVIGVMGLKKIFFDAVIRVSGQNARAFEEAAEAQEWLVQP